MAQSYTPPPLGLHPCIFSQVHTNKVLTFSFLEHIYINLKSIISEAIVNPRAEAFVNKFSNKHSIASYFSKITFIIFVLSFQIL